LWRRLRTFRGGGVVEEGGTPYVPYENSPNDPQPTGKGEEERLHKYDHLKWWELLDWDTMLDTWAMLSEELKEKIRKASLAPKEDKKK